MANRPTRTNLPEFPAVPESDSGSTLTSRRDLLRGALTGIVVGASVPVSPLSSASMAPTASVAPAVPTARAAWHTFEQALMGALTNLDEDEYLIVSSKKANHFVQFMAEGSFGLRSEAVSNVYLTAGAKLSSNASSALVALGWHAPTSGREEGDGPSPADIDGSSNFFLDSAHPIDYASLARLAVATLRQVYRIGHPGELEYSAGSTVDGGAALRFPLGIKRARS
jgi:hypothetical protein